MQPLIENDLLKRAIGYAGKVFLILRIGTLIWMAILALFVGELIHEPDVLCPTDSLLIDSRQAGFILEPWLRWDTNCYLKIAESGYQANPVLAVWPPVYPLLIRIFMLVASPSVLSALIISGLSTWLAFTLLYWLVAVDYGEKLARNTLFLLAIYPLAFFLVAGYTESLFLSFVLGSLLCARYQRWGWAGILAAGAVLTRNQGIVLVLPLMWEAILQVRAQPEMRFAIFSKAIFACTLPVISFFAFASYVHFGLQTDWPWQILTNYWAQHWGFPWQGFVGNVKALLDTSVLAQWFFWAPSRVLDLFFAFLVPGLLIYKARFIRSTYLVFAWSIVLIGLIKLGPGDILISFSRYLIPAFAFFLVLAPIIEKRPIRVGLLAIGLTLQSLFLGLFYLWSWAG